MNMPRFTSAALDAPSEVASSSRQDCQSPQEAGTREGWWARHTGGIPEEVSVLDTEAEDLVTDTLTAFRAALQQAENADSAPDLEVQKRDRDTSAGEGSLDYFAPAFRQVLGGEQSAETVGGGDGARREEAQPEEASDSLEYFAPAFHRALGTDAGAAAVSGAKEGSETEENASLDYFAPAFRRVLGDQERPTTETDDRRLSTDGQTGRLRSKEVMKDMSRRAGMEGDGVFRSGLNLDRIADCFFTSQSRSLVVSGG